MNIEILKLLAPYAALVVAMLCALAAYVFDAQEDPDRTENFNFSHALGGQSRGASDRNAWRGSWFFYIAGTIAIALAPYLFVVWRPGVTAPISECLVTWGGGLVSGALYFFLLGAFLASRQTKGRNERRENAEIAFKMIESAVLVLGIAFAMHAASTALDSLKKNADNNRTAARAQLYTADNEITETERTESKGKLSSLYANPKPDCKTREDARAYIAAMLGIITKDERILGSRDTAELYESIFGMKAYSGPGQTERDDIAELRKMILHCTYILNMLHAGFDDVPDIMDKREYDTWAGYFSDIGPHPSLLTSIWLWEKRGYMSEEFATEARRRLYTDAPEANRRIIDEFFPALAKNTFGHGLPKGYTRATAEMTP